MFCFSSLNENKTEVVIFGKHTSVNNLIDILGPLAPHRSNTVRKIEVFIDGSFKFKK